MRIVIWLMRRHLLNIWSSVECRFKNPSIHCGRPSDSDDRRRRIAPTCRKRCQDVPPVKRAPVKSDGEKSSRPANLDESQAWSGCSDDGLAAHVRCLQRRVKKVFVSANEQTNAFFRWLAYVTSLHRTQVQGVQRRRKFDRIKMTH